MNNTDAIIQFVTFLMEGGQPFMSEVRIPVKLNSHSGQREHPDP
ncbi:hypothetical protein [Aeromonas sp. QDB56]|nr:hypothetical protein [Aeromonas sp. QDB56]